MKLPWKFRAVLWRLLMVTVETAAAVPRALPENVVPAQAEIQNRFAKSRRAGMTQHWLYVSLVVAPDGNSFWRNPSLSSATSLARETANGLFAPNGGIAAAEEARIQRRSDRNHRNRQLEPLVQDFGRNQAQNGGKTP